MRLTAASGNVIIKDVPDMTLPILASFS